ncbi:MAG: hypothetical protein LCH30_03805 [Proteobacteria bacterium]|nr:hypothetical protein [Pseudomonadota bacterium]
MAFFKKNTYWLSDAWFYTQSPSLFTHAIFFPQKQSWELEWHESAFAPDKVLLKIPYYVGICALMLLTLPIDLLIGIVILPPSAVHDLFLCVSQCFEPQQDPNTFRPIF